MSLDMDRMKEDWDAIRSGWLDGVLSFLWSVFTFLFLALFVVAAACGFLSLVDNIVCLFTGHTPVDWKWTAGCTALVINQVFLMRYWTPMHETLGRWF